MIFKTCFYAILLYMSGPLAVFVPLPLVLVHAKKGKQAFWSALALVGVFLSFLYIYLIRTGWKLGTGALQGGETVDFLPRVLWYPSASGAMQATTGILQYGVYAGIAILLVAVYKRRWPIVAAFYVLFGAFVLALGALAVLVYAVEDRSLYAVMREGIHALLSQVVAQEKVDVALLPYPLERMAGVVVRLAAGAQFIWVWFAFLLNLALARRFSGERALFDHVGPFYRWQVPFYAVWALIAAVAVVLVHALVAPLGFLVDIALAVLVVLGGLYFAQGLAILVFFMNKWQVGVLGRVLVYVMITLLVQVLGILVLAFGFFDTWLDVRRLQDVTQKENHRGNHSN